MVFPKQIKIQKSLRHLCAKFWVVCSLRSPDNGLVSGQGVSNFLLSSQIYYQLKLLLLLKPKSYWLETWASNHSYFKEICLRQKIWKWRHVDIYDVMTLFRFFAKFGAIWKSVLLLNEKTIYTEFVSWFWKLASFSTKIVDVSNIWAWYRDYFLSNNIGLVSKYLCKIWSTYHLWLGR